MKWKTKDMVKGIYFEVTATYSETPFGRGNLIRLNSEHIPALFALIPTVCIRIFRV